MALSDEEMAKMLASQTAEEAAKPGLMESFGRGAVEGATFGFDDELGMDKERREASRKANPWTHFAGEMAGSVLPMVGTGGLGAVAKGSSLAARGARGIASVMAPGKIDTLGQSVAQGAKLGAVYGGLSGAGHADVKDSDSTGEGLLKRGVGAATGTALGAAVGAPLGAVGHGVSKVAQSIGGAREAARAETKDAGAGALTALSRSLDRDNITPQTLIDQITAELPQSKALSLPQVERLMTMANEGHTQKAIAQELGATPQSVGAYLKRLSATGETPLNIVDRSKLSGGAGAGENTEWTLRAASAVPGEARAVARGRLVERQLGQNQRLSDAITRHIGDADFDGRAAQLGSEIKATNDALYGAARQFDADQLASGNALDLQPVVDAYATKWAFSRGPVGDAIKEAVNAFRPAQLGHGGPNRPISTLDDFLQAKDELAALFDKYQGNRKIQAELMKFKTDLYRAVEKHNPQWKIANDAAADGFAAERALQLGTEFAGRLNTKMREHLAQFKEMSPPEQELYRIGLARALNDRLLNRQATHDLTSEFRLPAARVALREILGPKASKRFFDIIDREFATTQTYRSQFGSQTTPLKEAISDLNWAPQFESAWQMLSPKKIMEQVAVRAARQMQEARNKQLLDVMTIDDPIRQLDILRRAQGVHAARSNAKNTVGVPAVSSGAPLSDAMMSLRSTEDRPIDPSLVPMKPYRP